VDCPKPQLLWTFTVICLVFHHWQSHLGQENLILDVCTPLMMAILKVMSLEALLFSKSGQNPVIADGWAVKGTSYGTAVILIPYSRSRDHWYQ
jgi:hypothetical protein